MEGWVNINCPFCDDQSNHLGVFIRRPRKIKCWRCGEHNLPELLSYFSDKNIKYLYKEYKAEGEEEIVHQKKEKPVIPIEKIRKEFEENCTRASNEIYANYLRKRNFRPAEIFRDWKVQGGTQMGEYRYRLMIPVYHNGEIVSFQARDITGKQDPKYITCHGTNIKNYLYGLDYVQRDRVIITEGVTDVWRLGKGIAIATFGIEYVSKQIELIVKKDFKYVTVFFDSEPQAQRAASKLINHLELFGIHSTNFIMGDERDPADLSEEEAEEVISKIK